jgi:hypothetical protein
MLAFVYCHQESHGASIESERALKTGIAQYCYTVVSTLIQSTEKWGPI